MLASSSSMAQGFKEPSPGKAIVYFVSLKKSMMYEYFLNDKYIGILGKKNYKVLECDAGKQLIWASSEGKFFVESNLAAGGTYIVIVESTMGWWRNNPKLIPITSIHKDFAKACEMIKKKAPFVTSQEKVDQMNRDMVKFIPEELNNYEIKLKKEKEFPAITPDMAIPPAALK
jgi:hypothetical protein